MNVLIFAVLTVFSYLLGACPNGLLIARAKGVDIRTKGSGNIGATNVFRMVGKGAGILVFLLDALKGFIPAVVFPLVAGRLGSGDGFAASGVWFGVAAILGHNWPIYLGFKGGKGVATSAGVLVGVAPAAVGIGLLVWLGLLLSTRYVSVSSIGAAIGVAATGWIRYGASGLTLPAVLTFLAVLIVWRHRSNLQRLANGTEHRFSFRKAKPPSEGDDEKRQETSTGDENA